MHTSSESGDVMSAGAKTIWVILGLLVAVPKAASAQVRADPCHVPEIEQRVDYRGKVLELMGSNNPELGALLQARLEVAKRVPAELFQARQEAEMARLVAIGSEAVRDLARQLAEACSERISKRLSAELGAMKNTATTLRALLKLPMPQFEEQYRTATMALRRAFETDNRSAQTLREALVVVRR